jgi:hypothetical protein
MLGNSIQQQAPGFDAFEFLGPTGAKISVLPANRGFLRCAPSFGTPLAAMTTSATVLEATDTAHSSDPADYWASRRGRECRILIARL